ncbi:MAG: Holliday junction branch migration protein RuvA [Clostridia bacterium]|nr:Holliday junction branch migration protein RuvA [Clostridia bacterium]
MFAFIEGKVCEKSGNTLVLLAGGVGFQLTCSMNTLQAAPANGENMRCHTVFSVREDAMELYGFATLEEKRLFTALTGVSGVGPKMALALLGAMPLRDLELAILMEDIATLSRAPGIGKKTAQRIALELRDKVSQAGLDHLPDVPAAASAAPAASDALSEALQALQALGYTPAEARAALNQVKNTSDRPDALISAALRAMAGA